jgi:hypothetical protein
MVRLVAQFSILRRAGGTHGVTLLAPTRGPTTADLVAAMSEVVGQLADRIAASLAVG